MNRLTVFLAVLTGLAIVATVVVIAFALVPSLLPSFVSAVGFGSFLGGAAILVP